MANQAKEGCIPGLAVPGQGDYHLGQASSNKEATKMLTPPGPLASMPEQVGAEIS